MNPDTGTMHPDAIPATPEDIERMERGYREQLARRLGLIDETKAPEPDRYMYPPKQGPALPPTWPRFTVGEAFPFNRFDAQVTKITRRGLKVRTHPDEQCRIGSELEVKGCVFRVVRKRGPDLTLSPVTGEADG